MEHAACTARVDRSLLKLGATVFGATEVTATCVEATEPGAWVVASFTVGFWVLSVPPLLHEYLLSARLYPRCVWPLLQM